MQVPLSFVVHVESRGLPVTALKFLGFTVALGIEEMTLIEFNRAVLHAGKDAASLRAAGLMLTAVRTQHDLTQQMLAARSEQSETPVRKSFISRLEAGKIPAVVIQLAHLIALVGADAALLRELVSIVPIKPQRRSLGSFAEMRSRIIEYSRSGRHQRALGLSLAIAGDSERSALERAKGMLCTAIVFANRGSWKASRYLTLQILEDPACDAALRMNALVQLIWTETNCADGGSIDRWLSELLRIPNRSPEAELLCWAHVALAELTRKDAEKALRAIERARARDGAHVPVDRRLGSLLALARVLAKLRRRTGARSALLQLERLLFDEGPVLKAAFFTGGAEVAREIGELTLARELATRGTVASRELENRHLLLRGQVILCETALDRNDLIDARGLCRLISAHEFDAGLNPALRARIKTLKRLLRRGG